MADMSAARTRQFVIAAILLGAGFIGGFLTGKRTTMIAWSSIKEGCDHLDGSRWECPDTLGPSRLFSTGNDILGGSMTLTTASDTHHIRLQPGVDAVFLTPAGLRILQEHYVATDSAKAAAVAQYLDWTSRNY